MWGDARTARTWGSFLLDTVSGSWHDSMSMTTTLPRFSGIVRAAAAALALALVPTLSAAQTAPAKKKPAPAAATAPDPAPAPAPAARASSSSLPYGITVGIGPSFEGSTALKLRLEGSMQLRPLFPNSTFELALPLGFVFWGQSEPLFYPYSFDYSYFRFEVVPTARIGVPVAKDLGLYGDAGIGFQYYHVSFSTNYPYSYFPFSLSSSGAGGIFKLAGGGYWSIDPHWRLFLEPIGLNFYFGGGSGFVYSIMLGAGYHF